MFHWLRSRRPTASKGSTRLHLEALEDRAVPSASGSQFAAPTYVYTETNNPQAGLNAVLAYRRDADTGALTQTGSFATGGTGQLNQPKLVGPDDGDQQVQTTADGKFLYAVNEGSGTVSAFRIREHGNLDLIGTFSSGGVEPDSIGIAGNTLYVANRGNAAKGQPGTVAPNVTAFRLHGDGSLSKISNSPVSFPVDTFVTQTLVSHNGRFLFVEAATLDGVTGGNTLNTFRINSDGSLTAAPGGPASFGANAPILLGAANNPNFNIVYTGFTSTSQIGVFTYDATGRTSYVGPTADTGAGPCWLVVSADGRFLYSANTGSDSVTVYSLANPLQPVEIQELPLGGPRGVSAAGKPITNAFEIALDPTGKYLYAVTQTTDPTFPQGNQLHTLAIAGAGTLSEPVAPVIFSQADVPAIAHPQGLAVVQLDFDSYFDDVDYFEGSNHSSGQY